MRIGLLSQWYDPEPGGGAVPGVLADALVSRNHDVKVLTGFPNYPTGQIYPGYRQRWRHLESPAGGPEVRRVPLYPSHDGNPLKRVANYTSFGASARAQASSYFRDREALWVYNSPATVGAVGRHLAVRGGIPLLVHVMDLWPDSVLDSGMLARGWARRAAESGLTGVVKRTHEAASIVAVTSPGQVALLEQRGVPANKLRYIPVWADENVFSPRPADRTLLPPAARDARVVLMYAGAMGHVQRLDTAIRAAAKAGPELHFVLAGTGLAEESLRRLAREAAASNVHFMGPQPQERMGDLAASADVHLVSLDDTPLLRVTMPSKVQSIMAAGKPIIAACAGDAAAVVEQSGAGVAVTPGDETGLAQLFRELAVDEVRLQAYGRSARRHYDAEFSRDAAVTRVEQALHEIGA